MPFVDVEWTPKSIEMRREVAKAITEIICRVTGNAPETVRISFSEKEPEYIARGGMLFSDQERS